MSNKSHITSDKRSSETNHVSGEELDIIGVIKLLWSQKILIACVIVFCSLLSIWFALTEDEIYMAEIKAMPSEFSLTPTENSLSATIALRMRGFGQAVGEYEKHLVAVQILRSKSFIQGFISRHNLIPMIYGVSGYDSTSKSVVWNQDIYDSEKEVWLLDPPPTLQEATQRFLLNNLIIDDNRNSRVLTVRVFHHSPVIAAELAEQLITDLNSHMQNRELSTLSEELSYYRKELEIVVEQSSRELLLGQIEQATYKQALAKANTNYTFEVIDPPLVPEKRVFPRRGLIVILGTFLGGILALVLAFIRLLLFPQSVQISEKNKHQDNGQ